MLMLRRGEGYCIVCISCVVGTLRVDGRWGSASCLMLRFNENKNPRDFDVMKKDLSRARHGISNPLTNQRASTTNYVCDCMVL